MKFIKLLVAGKDYIYIPDQKSFCGLSGKEIIRLCNRQKGIGADGIITFIKTSSKTVQIKGFHQNGKDMLDISSASLCTVFDDIFKNNTIECSRNSKKNEKITLLQDKNDFDGLFSCDMGPSAACTYREKKTEAGNRIITLTAQKLHGIHTVHFSECADLLDINYFGKNISENSLFHKKADFTIAEKTGKNTFRLIHYENSTASPFPTLAVFASAALSAVITGRANYNEEIKLMCNTDTVYAFCKKNGSAVLQCKAEKIFEGYIQKEHRP